MKPKQLPNIAEDFLKEYYEKNILCNTLSKEVSEMSKRIKYEMEKVGRSESQMYGYYLRLETKYEPNRDFIDLIFSNELDGNLIYTVRPNRLKGLIHKLGLTNKEYQEKYAQEKSTKWLKVNK